MCRKLKTRKSKCFASTTQFMRMTSRVPSWCSKFVSWRQTRLLSFTSTTGHQASTSLRRIKTSLRKRWLFRKAQTRFRFSGTMIWSIFLTNFNLFINWLCFDTRIIIFIKCWSLPIRYITFYHYTSFPLDFLYFKYWLIRFDCLLNNLPSIVFNFIIRSPPLQSLT